MSDKEDKNDRNFSATEVGTLIESFRSDLTAVAEGVTALRADVDILKADVSELKTDVRLIKDTLRVAIPRPRKTYYSP